jgi:hypothetical protein
VSLGHNISVVEERLRFQAAEIAKMSTIHDALLEKERQVHVHSGGYILENTTLWGAGDAS